MLFWFASVKARVDRLRIAEERLLALAPRFGSKEEENGCSYTYQIDAFDTVIPRSVVPLASHEQDQVDLSDEDSYIIHGVRATSTHSHARDGNDNDDRDGQKSSTPLILLHGYMNGAAYFFRNIAGLSERFSSLYALDLLGWGLSSRPKFVLRPEEAGESSSSSSSNTGNTALEKQDYKLRTAEDFFVESLEAWRRANDIPTMILAGHSMGGYIGVAYAERYPQRVEKLLLLSPAGVPADSSASEERIARARQQSLFFRALSTTWYYLFEWNHTVGGILRSMPSRQAQNMASRYVQRRLPAITDPHEQEVLSEYLLANSLLPGSGEYCVHSFLTSSLQGRKPAELRIPHLQVPCVSFLYGTRDWMDIDGGLRAQARCDRTSSKQSPDVAVYRVKDAGHLLMLDNYQEHNSGIIAAVGLKATNPQAEHVVPSEKHYLAVAEYSPTLKEHEVENSESPTVEVAAA